MGDPGEILPWVSLGETIKCTHLIGSTKCILVKKSLLKCQNSMDLEPSSLKIRLGGEDSLL